MVYRKRPDEPSDKRPILDALGRCRKVAVDTTSSIRPGAPLYAALERVKTAIDYAAEVLGKPRDYYHDKGSSGPDNGWRDSGR